MSDAFTGRIPDIKKAPEDTRIYAPFFCNDDEFHKMPAREQSMTSRLALLDEMLDYGWRHAYEYSQRYRHSESLCSEQRVFMGFLDIVNDWKARVSVLCQHEIDELNEANQ